MGAALGKAFSTARAKALRLDRSRDREGAVLQRENIMVVFRNWSLPALALVLADAGQAQVKVKFTPEPMSVPTAALSDARSLGRWIVEVCNDGPAPVSLPWERISMATEIRFIDPDDAQLVLLAAQRKTVAGAIMRFGALAGQGAALGLTVASRANALLAAGLTVGSTLLPGVVRVAAGEVPPIAPLISGLKYPIALAAGACATDHRFAAKMRSARVVTAIVNVPGVQETNTTFAALFDLHRSTDILDMAR